MVVPGVEEVNHLISAPGSGRKEYGAPPPNPGITKMTIFPVGFSQTPCASAGWVSGAGHLHPGHCPALPGSLWPGQAASVADVNGFERRNGPLGVCKTFVRKGKKKKCLWFRA